MLGALRIVTRDHRGHRHYRSQVGDQSPLSGPNARIDRSGRPSGPTTPTRASFLRPIHPLSWLGKAAKLELGPRSWALLRLLSTEGFWCCTAAAPHRPQPATGSFSRPVGIWKGRARYGTWHVDPCAGGWLDMLKDEPPAFEPALPDTCCHCSRWRRVVLATITKSM